MDAFVELFNFQGRANRAWYFWHILLDDLVIFGLVVALVVIGSVIESPLVLVPGLGVLFAGIWAGVAITVKRLHDVERPGWHVLLFAVPLYNIYLGLVLLFRRGTVGPNRFGRDPLQMGVAPALEAGPVPS